MLHFLSLSLSSWAKTNEVHSEMKSGKSSFVSQEFRLEFLKSFVYCGGEMCSTLIFFSLSLCSTQPKFPSPPSYFSPSIAVGFFSFHFESLYDTLITSFDSWDLIFSIASVFVSFQPKAPLLSHWSDIVFLISQIPVLNYEKNANLAQLLNMLRNRGQLCEPHVYWFEAFGLTLHLSILDTWNASINEFDILNKCRTMDF